MEEMQQIETKTKKSKVAAYVLIGLVIGLLIFSTVQTFQLGGLEKSLISGDVVSSGASASPAGSSPLASTVPAMVGGC